MADKIIQPPPIIGRNSAAVGEMIAEDPNVIFREPDMTNEVTAIKKPDTLAEAKTRGAGVPMRQIGGAFAPNFRDMGQVMEFAATMAGAGVMVGPAVRGNPGACMAVTMMAGRFNLDPFMLSTKAYIVKNNAGEETLNWEAQAVNAMILGAGVLQAPLGYEYSGEGEDRRVRVFGALKGEGERDILTNTVRSIRAKSPLWSKDPDQQLAYYGSRMWIRRHAAHVLMGVYTADEIDGGQIIDGTPKPDPAARLTASIAGTLEADVDATQVEDDEGPSGEPESQPEPPQAATQPSTEPSEDDEWHDIGEVEAVFAEVDNEIELGAALDTALALSWVTEDDAANLTNMADTRHKEITA